MTNLSTQIEKAVPGDERAWDYNLVWCERVSEVVWPMPAPDPASKEYTEWWDINLQFENTIKAGAYLSAAMMLVPDGWTYEGRQDPSGSPHTWTLSTIKTGDVKYTTVSGKANSAILALLAAICRARGL